MNGQAISINLRIPKDFRGQIDLSIGGEPPSDTPLDNDSTSDEEQSRPWYARIFRWMFVVSGAAAIGEAVKQFLFG